MPRTFVPRPRLLQLLTGWRGARLISLVAPTGYGKSTFTAWWLQQISGDPPPLVVWLPLDPDGASTDMVLQTLVAALRPTFPALDDLHDRHAAGQLSTRQLAHAIVAEIERGERRLVLVIDDFQSIDEPTVTALLQDVLDRRPSFLHLVLLSRTRPSLHVGRLVLEDAAIFLDERHLRFDHDEFTTFVGASPLAALAPAQRDIVEERCDGWIAALQLLALSVSRESIDALLGPRSGHLLLEHLEFEVFRRLPSELQRFLVEVGPLPFLTAPLVAAATGRTLLESESLLQRALDANVFLTPLDSPSTSGAARFRFHPLFRELLRRKLLDAADPAAADALRRRAAQWLADHEEIDAALSLLLPTDAAAAAQLVAHRLRPALLNGNLLAARRWLDRLPAAQFEAYPSLAVDAAWLALLSNGRDLAARIAAARAALAGHANAEQAAEIDVLHAFALYVNNQRDAAGTAAAAVRLPAADSGLASGYFHMLQALLHDQPEQLDVRLRALQQAGEIFRALGLADAALDTQLGACVLERRAGRSLAAVSAYEHALAVIRHFGRDNSSVAIDAHIQFGEHLYLLDRIAAARAQFECATAIVDRVSPTSLESYRALLNTQLCTIAAGGAGLVIDEDDDARRWAAVVADHPPLFTVSTAWVRFLRDVCLDRLDRARRTVDVFGMRPNHLAADAHEYLRLLILAGAVLTDEPDARLTGVLLAFRDEMQATHNAIVAARASSLLALHFLRLDDEPAARAEARAMQTDAEQLLMPRLLSDFPALLHLLAHRPDRHDLRAFGLSRQEARVLAVLAEDLTNKEIAARLSLSTATVGTHLQNLYRKLGVHSRDEAVRAARGDGDRGGE